MRNTDQLSPIQKTILTCVADNPHKFNRSELAKLLVGSSSTRIAGHEQNPYFARLTEEKRKHIATDIDILLQQSFLKFDSNHKIMASQS